MSSWNLWSGTHTFFSFTINSRVDADSQVIPSKLYMTTIYHVNLKFANFSCATPSVIVKIEFVYSGEPDMTLKDAHSITDASDLALLFQGNFYEGQSKLRFTSSSFHHDKKSFLMKLSFYSGKNLVACYLSNPFKVLARRDAKSEGGVKRCNDIEYISPVMKKTKYEEFIDCLAKLDSLKGQLSDYEQTIAIEEIKKRYCNIDHFSELDLWNLESNVDSL